MPPIRHGLEMNARLAGRTNRQCACRVPPDVTEQADYVLGRHLQPLADFGEMVFGEQFGEPGQQPVCSDWA